MDKQCSQQRQTLGPSLSVLDISLPEHTNNPFVQDTNKGRFPAEHKEWIQRRDQLSHAHDVACGRLSGRWSRGQIHQQWLRGSCASASQHILTQPVASPAPCSGHHTPVLATRPLHLAQRWDTLCASVGTHSTENAGPSHQLCSFCPLTIVPVPWARIRKRSMVGKRIPNGNQAQGVAAEPSPSRVGVSSPLWGD